MEVLQITKLLYENDRWMPEETSPLASLDAHDAFFGPASMTDFEQRSANPVKLF